MKNNVGYHWEIPDVSIDSFGGDEQDGKFGLVQTKLDSFFSQGVIQGTHYHTL